MNEIDDIVKVLEEAADYSNDAKNSSDNSEDVINSAIKMINELQEIIDQPKHCDKCKALIDLKK